MGWMNRVQFPIEAVVGIFLFTAFKLALVPDRYLG
jgi:hypothetical protein